MLPYRKATKTSNVVKAVYIRLLPQNFSLEKLRVRIVRKFISSISARRGTAGVEKNPVAHNILVTEKITEIYTKEKASAPMRRNILSLDINISKDYFLTAYM
uniref:Uncharacterized protein n=1 Tax=Romanomermis culicivorax TaxID=13658 RepID=A0A915I6V8_ROMCU